MAFAKGTYYRLKTKVAQKLTDDRYVIMLVSPEKLVHRQIEGVVAHRFKDLDDIPDAILRVLPQSTGEASSIIAKNFDLGLRLSVVTVGGAFGSMGWVRLGKDFKWILPLQPNDVVLGRAYTSPQMRGRGLYGQLNISRLQEKFDGQAEGGRVFGDIHVNNNASIRHYLKTGAYELIARVRPLGPDALDRIYHRVGVPRA